MDIIRSNGYKRIISGNDKMVKLIHKNTKKEYYPMFKNMFGEIYYFDADNNIVFIRGNRINNYEIVEV